MNPEDLFRGLISRGLPPHIARGFVVNALDESGLNPGINEAAPIVPGSRGGYGLMQWTGPRRRALEAFAAERGANVADPNVQMDFLLTELHGPERGAWQAIQQAATPEDAAAAIVNRFLRPAESHRARREAKYRGGVGAEADYAENALAGYQPPSLPAQLGQPAQLPEIERQEPRLDWKTAMVEPMQMQGMNALAAPQYDTRPHLGRGLF